MPTPISGEAAKLLNPAIYVETRPVEKQVQAREKVVTRRLYQEATRKDQLPIHQEGGTDRDRYISLVNSCDRADDNPHNPQETSIISDAPRASTATVAIRPSASTAKAWHRALVPWRW